jgi:hypothetical protein
MKAAVPVTLRWAYSLALLFAIYPFLRAGWDWIRTGFGGIGGALSLLIILPMPVLGLYRIYLVARVPGTLASYPAAGFARALRALGMFGIYIGALASIASVAAGPLMRALMTHHTESGAEYFVVGMYLSMLGGVGTLGLICFELSRLVAFEREAWSAARET